VVRETNVRDYEAHDEVHQDSYSPGNESESVITEIVENKIVYLDSEKDPQEQSEEKLQNQRSSDREKQIQEYLDIDKADYVNTDEYDGPQDEPVELTEEQQREYDELEARKQELLGEKKELEGIIDDLNTQLDVSQPAVDQARSALDQLSAGNITEMKSLARPPSKVEQVGN
jgi:hypothetical protein